jgi:hypothetical protein
MGINISVFFFIVAFEANLSPVNIRSSPQHERASHMVVGVAGQALDAAVIKWKRKIRCISRYEIGWVVVFGVIMTAETG